MSRINRIFLMLWCVLWAAGTFGQTRSAVNNTQRNSILERQVIGDELQHLTTSGAFREALLTTNLPGGMAVKLGCEEEPTTQRWKPMGVSLRSALDWIVAEDGQYRWQVEQGVINLLPKSGLSPLLKVRIRQLYVEDVKSVHQAYGELMSLPEVRKAVDNLGFKDSFERIQGSGSLPKDQPGFSVHCENVTVREALNAIAKAHGRAVWVYKERHCKSKHGFSIEFTVQ